jgi:HTH-type transcriptional regulator/antitoxin HigA
MKPPAAKQRATHRSAAKPRANGRHGANGRLARAYLELIGRFPLRPLRSERDYDAAIAILDTLAVRPEGSLSPGEQDYFDTLTMLVEAYDAQHYRIVPERREPLETLRYLMQESGMTQADLARLLGSRSAASLILGGHRRLSKSHIQKLAEHFRVSPALFLGNERA